MCACVRPIAFGVQLFELLSAFLRSSSTLTAKIYQICKPISYKIFDFRILFDHYCPIASSCMLILACWTLFSLLLKWFWCISWFICILYISLSYLFVSIVSLFNSQLHLLSHRVCFPICLLSRTSLWSLKHLINEKTGIYVL